MSNEKMQNNEQSPANKDISVIHEKLRVVERDIKEIKQNNTNYRNHIETRMNRQDDKINALEKSYYRLDTMFADFMSTQKKVEDNLDKIADKVDRDDNWRGLIIDLIKIGLVIITFVATGRWLITLN